MIHCWLLTSVQVFDLKGSMRSRYVDPSKDSIGDVLLDENYLNSEWCLGCVVYDWACGVWFMKGSGMWFLKSVVWVVECNVWVCGVREGHYMGCGLLEGVVYRDVVYDRGCGVCMWRHASCHRSGVGVWLMQVVWVVC